MNDDKERISRKLRRMSLLSLNDPNNKTVLAKMDMAKQLYVLRVIQTFERIQFLAHKFNLKHLLV